MRLWGTQAKATDPNGLDAKDRTSLLLFVDQLDRELALEPLVGYVAYNMIDNTGREAAFIANEVDRYTSWPGQALGYMIGQPKVQELRDRARAKLGDRFDIRRFHMAVLGQGAVPLWVLDRLIDDWVAEETKRR